MRQEQVEMLSEATNAAVMRHPASRFPGVLIQGDTLYNLCRQADAAWGQLERGDPGFDDVNEVRKALWDLLNHYKAVLGDHNLPLPFSEKPA